MVCCWKLSHKTVWGRANREIVFFFFYSHRHLSSFLPVCCLDPLSHSFSFSTPREKIALIYQSQVRDRTCSQARLNVNDRNIQEMYLNLSGCAPSYNSLTKMSCPPLVCLCRLYWNILGNHRSSTYCSFPAIRTHRGDIIHKSLGSECKT